MTDTSKEVGVEITSMLIQCDAHKTCLKECIARKVVNFDEVLPGSEEYFFLSDPGSCYHNHHSDGKFREASIRRVNENSG